MHMCVQEYMCIHLCACNLVDVYQRCMLSECCVIVLSLRCRESCWESVCVCAHAHTHTHTHTHSHTHTHTIFSTLISCFQHLSIFLLCDSHSPSSVFLFERDLWSKISAAVMPFSVDWQMIQAALWAPVGMAADQYPSWLPVSIHTNTCSHIHTHKHTRTHRHIGTRGVHMQG